MSSPAESIFRERNRTAPQKASAVWPYFKRLLDLLGAFALMIVFSPVIVITAIILGFGGGGILFSQRRIGRNGKPFRCYKFRSMVPHAEQALTQLLENDPMARAEWESTQKLRHDPRVTRIGAFLRKTSLDELPQLINVFRGEMSLVGPRPIIEAELVRYGRASRWYTCVRPGITGLWQVSGRSDTDYRRRIALDIFYSKNHGFKVDILILFKTVLIVLNRRGAY